MDGKEVLQDDLVHVQAHDLERGSHENHVHDQVRDPDRGRETRKSLAMKHERVNEREDDQVHVQEIQNTLTHANDRKGLDLDHALDRVRGDHFLH